MARNYVRKGPGRPSNKSNYSDKPVGRPPEYTPEILGKAASLIRIGYTHEETCEMLDISRQTYYRWQKEYPEFSDRIKQARHELETTGSDSIYWLMQKQTLRKKKTYQVTDEKGNTLTKTEIFEEEIPPHVTAVLNHVNRRARIYQEEGRSASKGTFMDEFKRARVAGEAILRREAEPEATSELCPGDE